jgi:hypothetical protein
MKFTFSLSFGIDVERNPKLSAAELRQIAIIKRKLELDRLYQINGVERK